VRSDALQRQSRKCAAGSCVRLLHRATAFANVGIPPGQTDPSERHKTRHAGSQLGTFAGTGQTVGGSQTLGRARAEDAAPRGHTPSRSCLHSAGCNCVREVGRSSSAVNVAQSELGSVDGALIRDPSTAGLWSWRAGRGFKARDSALGKAGRRSDPAPHPGATHSTSQWLRRHWRIQQTTRRPRESEALGQIGGGRPRAPFTLMVQTRIDGPSPCRPQLTAPLPTSR